MLPDYKLVIINSKGKKKYFMLEESDYTTRYLISNIFNNFQKQLDQPNRIMPTLTRADMPNEKEKENDVKTFI